MSNVKTNTKSIINYKDSLVNQTTKEGEETMETKQETKQFAQDELVYRFVDQVKIAKETKELAAYLAGSKGNDGYPITTDELLAVRKIVNGSIKVDDLIKQFESPTHTFEVYLNKVVEIITITPADVLNHDVAKVENHKPFNWKGAVKTAKAYTRKGVEIGVSAGTSLIAGTVKTAVELTVVAGKAGVTGVKDGLKKS